MAVQAEAKIKLEPSAEVMVLLTDLIERLEQLVKAINDLSNSKG